VWRRDRASARDAAGWLPALLGLAFVNAMNWQVLS